LTAKKRSDIFLGESTVMLSAC